MRKVKKTIISPILAFAIFATIFCTSAQLSTSKKFKTAAAEDQNEGLVYAKARENCFLFATENTSDTSLDNILFTIPVGYFVRITDRTSENTFKVIYIDRVGFVSSESVRVVSITPTNPFESPQQLQTKSGSGTQLRQRPSTSSSAIALIPPNSTITYIASAIGEKPTDGLSQNWYFIQFFPPAEPTIYYEGYIYSERVSAEPTKVQNTEDDPSIPLPLTDSAETESTTLSFSHSPSWLKGILIAVMCLPCILFVLYAATRIIQSRKSKAEQI